NPRSWYFFASASTCGSALRQLSQRKVQKSTITTLPRSDAGVRAVELIHGPPPANPGNEPCAVNDGNDAGRATTDESTPGRLLPGVAPSRTRATSRASAGAVETPARAKSAESRPDASSTTTAIAAAPNARRTHRSTPAPRRSRSSSRAPANSTTASDNAAPAANAR